MIEKVNAVSSVNYGLKKFKLLRKQDQLMIFARAQRIPSALRGGLANCRTTQRDSTGYSGNRRD